MAINSKSSTGIHSTGSHWSRWPALLDRVLDENTGAEARATAIAKTLREMVPDAESVGCRLTTDDGDALVLEPADAATMRGLQKQLADVPDHQSVVSNLRCPSPSLMRSGIAVRVARGSRRWGWLIVGDSREAGLEPLLCLAANVLCLRLELEEAERLRRTALADQVASAELMTSGEAMSGLVHELNNSLNSMLLQAAVVEMKADPALRGEVAAIRNEGAYAAARLAWIQRQRERCREHRCRVDLQCVIEEVLAFCPPIADRVKLDFAHRPVIVVANPVAVRRLLACLFCVIEGIRTVADGELVVQTTHSEGQPCLLFQAAPWGPAAGRDTELLDLQDDDLATEHVLERLATLSLARLADVTIHASIDAKGALAVTLTWANPANEQSVQSDQLPIEQGVV